MGPGWWQAGDGRHYPPESHPRFGKRPEPGSGFTVVSAKKNANRKWAIVAVVLVLAIGGGGWWFSESVAQSARDSTRERAERVRERAAEQEREIQDEIDKAEKELEEQEKAEQQAREDAAVGQSWIGQNDDVSFDGTSVTFEDDFLYDDTGWPVVDSAGSKSGYVPDEFFLVSESAGGLDLLSPNDEPRRQIAVSATVSLLPGTKELAGGVRCTDGDPTTTAYSFGIDGEGNWTLRRTDPGSGEGSPVVTELGRSPLTDGLAYPSELSLVCAMLDDRTVRLVAYLDGELMVDTVEESSRLDTDGLLGGLWVRGQGAQFMVKKYEERDFNP